MDERVMGMTALARWPDAYVEAITTEEWDEALISVPFAWDIPRKSLLYLAGIYHDEMKRDRIFGPAFKAFGGQA